MYYKNIDLELHSISNYFCNTKTVLQIPNNIGFDQIPLLLKLCFAGLYGIESEQVYLETQWHGSWVNLESSRQF